jgi:DHA2 family multidrug resistance protein
VTPPGSDGQVSSAQKWAITLSVMVVAFMQVLDTSVTNVVLPHLQGSLSAGLEEVSWVLTSYLAANAVIIPATGWLAGLLGRKRFFLICAALFTVSSFLSGIAPNLTFLIVARIFQGIGGGPIIPLSQAILWEIFPLGQRGLAMAVWGIGFMMGPIIGPTLGGYIADNWSWRWIFYINLPVGFLGFFMASAFLFDPPYLRKPGRVDWPGLTLMVLGFGCLQLSSIAASGRTGSTPPSSSPSPCSRAAPSWASSSASSWPESPSSISGLRRPQLRHRRHLHRVHRARHVLEHAPSRHLHPEAPRLRRVDIGTGARPGRLRQHAVPAHMRPTRHANGPAAAPDLRLRGQCHQPVHDVELTLSVDYWTLAFPRFIQGFALGFIFVPLSTLTLSTIARDKLVNATSAYNVLRNLGGSVGIALATTFLAQRSQYHQANLVGPRERLGSRHPGAAPGLDRSLHRPRRRYLHRPAARARHALQRHGGTGPGAGLRRRLLAPRHPLLDHSPVPPRHAARPRRPPRPREDDSSDSGRVPPLPASVD